MITADELTILRKPEVQEYIREKQGRPRLGDLLLRKLTVFGELLDSQIWMEEKLWEIVCIRQESSISGYWYCVSENGEEWTLTDEQMIDETCYRIPDCISRDSSRPERGLWGMIDWDVIRAESVAHGELSIREWGSGGWMFWEMPRLALLKALEWQMGWKP
jgi:hypothetical protein